MDPVIVNIIISTLAFVFAGVCVVLCIKKHSAADIDDKLQKQSDRIDQALSSARQEINSVTQTSVANISAALNENQKLVFSQQDKRIEELTKNLSGAQELLQSSVTSMLKASYERIESLTSQSEKNAHDLRQTLETQMEKIRQDNEKRLAEIKSTVDEKLQSTLEDRISRSFKDVSERLEQVYKGLGEMQTLASGVGDLKKVLTNVKTRGILGEIQLGAILDQILSPEQYETNVVTAKGTDNRVEFAVKLPGGEGGTVYLPIDSKFPADAYISLCDAYESADAEQIKLMGSQLERRVKDFAKDIQKKYISPPYTTDFAIMFLPTEGLYAEVVRRGLVETLQQNYKINIAGPTTMAALLNSLQTGFRTLAIQKRSSEVWDILGAVKTEFDKFESVLKQTQLRIDQANKELDDLIGTRTRQIQRKLKDVSVLPEEKAEKLLND